MEEAEQTNRSRGVTQRALASQQATRPRVSLLRYSPALVLLASATLDMYRFADPDLWWHVMSGRMMLTTWHFTAFDPFSYSAPNHIWLHHEWLSELIEAWIFTHFGVLGIKLLKFVCSAAVVSFLVLAIGETGAPVTIQLGVTLASVFAIVLEMQYRPQMFSFVMFAGLLWMLTRANYRRRAPLWIAVPILAIWSNLHGGFILGVFALATYAAVIGIQDFVASRGLQRGLILSSIAMLGLAASLANPIGLESWRAIIIVFKEPLTSQVIADWRPLFFRLTTTPVATLIGLYFWYFAALILVAAILFATVPVFDDLPLVAIAALMILAAFSATRNISFAAIAVAPPLAHRLAILMRRYRDLDADPYSARRGFANEAVAFGIAAAIAFSTGLFSGRLRDASSTPSGAVAFMQSRGLHGNILNDFGWGYYLIWHTAPANKVFIDTRYNFVYPHDVIADYVSFQSGDPESAAILKKYPHDYVLINVKCGAFDLMMHQADWQLIYRDPEAALFARADSPAAKIAGIPVQGNPATDYFP